ncbi:MAG: hypothetical protein J6O70_08045 [Lachnospiraceae bacterium]|nr:hypothetical protein [Lachnospiraceae bacterium]
MGRRKRHNRIVIQRIFAFILTILVIAIIAFGGYMGVNYVLNNTDIKSLFEKKPQPEVTAAEEPSEEASEDGDIWVRVQKETISDDYADVDTSILSENEVSENETPVDTDAEIELFINHMALEEKVAQLFIVTPEQITGMDVVSRAGETTKNALTEYPVGGLIYFAQNLEDPDQTKEMLSNTSSYIIDACGIAPFLSVDEEGGKVTRVASNESFEVENIGAMSDIGAAGDIDKAYDAGTAIGKYLKPLGFNLDLAPVADVLDDNVESIIGDRAFSSDPETVSRFSWQFASGLQDSGVTACFKHYPGHGSVSGDTHAEAVYQSKTKEELMETDLVPFQNAALSDARMIMASHITCREITGDDTPTSLSKIMLTDILRNELGFNGVIITDAMNMGAVTNIYPDSGEAAITAINAGADIILMPADFHEAYNAVLSAASSGQIETERVNDSLRRILKIKLGKY